MVIVKGGTKELHSTTQNRFIGFERQIRRERGRKQNKG